MRTSGRCVSTSGRSPPLWRKRSATAFLIFNPAKFRLLSGLCCAVTSTLKLSRAVNQISQATALAASYRSFSLRYGVCDNCISTRWASRLCRFSSIASRQDARNATPSRPVSRSLPARPVSRCTSSARNPSTPAAQGRNNRSRFTAGFPELLARRGSKRFSQVRRCDAQRLAVLGNRAASAFDALLLEHVRQLAVRQRLVQVLGGYELLDQRAHRGARRVAAGLGPQRRT